MQLVCKTVVPLFGDTGRNLDGRPNAVLKGKRNKVLREGFVQNGEGNIQEFFLGGKKYFSRTFPLTNFPGIDGREAVACQFSMHV